MRAADAARRILPDPETQAEFFRSVNGKRFFAWIIDMVLIAVLSALALPFTLFLGLLVFPLMILVIGFFYRWFTLGAFSATPGMVVAGIQLRKSDGLHFDGGTAFAHTLGYSISVAVPVLQIISIVLMLTTARKQGLTDHILGTFPINRPAVL